MLRWLSEVARNHEVRNDYIRGAMEVVPIADKELENKLIRLLYVLKRGETEAGSDDGNRGERREGREKR